MAAMGLLSKLAKRWDASYAVTVSAVDKLKQSPGDFVDRATPEEKLHLGILLGTATITVGLAITLLLKGRRRKRNANTHEISGGSSAPGKTEARIGNDVEDPKSSSEKRVDEPAGADGIQTTDSGLENSDLDRSAKSSSPTRSMASPSPSNSSTAAAAATAAVTSTPSTTQSIRESKDFASSFDDPANVSLKESPSAVSSSPSFVSPGPQVILPVGVGTPLGVASPDVESSRPVDVSKDLDLDHDSDGDVEDGLEPLDLAGALKLVDELTNSLSQFHDGSMVETYGSFVACLISMQKVFQRPDWGYAEWPDVVAVLNKHSGTQVYDEKWSTLQSELTQRGFPSIPIFDGNMSQVELLQIMQEMLTASQKVATSVAKLKRTGDEVIDAHHTFLEQQSMESFYAWRDLCSQGEFEAVENAASFEKGNGTQRVIVPATILKQWKDGYLVRAMLNMMSPLTKLQEANMCKYGIGATHFQNLVSKFSDDPEVSVIKAQLENIMALIHPPAADPESEESDSSYSSDESGSADSDSDS